MSFSVVVVSVFWLYARIKEKHKANLQQDILQIAKTAANEIPSESFVRIVKSKDKHSAEYGQISRILQQYRKTNSNIAYIYTVAKTPTTDEDKQVQFIVDPPITEAEKHVHSKEEEPPAEPGDPYDAREVPMMLKAFETACVEDEFARDQWGTTLSGYCPILDAEGKTVGVMGVDMFATSIEQQAPVYIKECIKIGIFVILVSVFMSVFISYRINLSVNEIHKGIQRVQAEDYGKEITLSKNNSFYFIAKAFNRMQELVSLHTKNLMDTNRLLEEEIEERKNVEQALIIAKNEAETANRAKTSFLAVISHEIKTPLHHILGFAQLLQEDLEDDCLDHVKIIETSGKELLIIVNDIIDYASLESGGMKMETGSILVREELESALHREQEICRKKQVDFRFKVSDNVPEMVFGNNLYFQKVCVHLVSNAVKFTEKGFVEILIEKIEENTPALWLQIIVRDTGIGIGEANRDRLFKPFSQVEYYATRKSSGTGLGLCICKSIVTQLNGTIAFESELGKGSTFTVKLPFRAS